MRRMFCLLILFMMQSQLFAQANLRFRDNAGDLVGTLIQLVEEATSCNLNPMDRPLISCKAVVRQGTYFMQINLVTGELEAINTWYTEANCGGNPYFREEEIGQRGGFMYAIREAETPQVARIDWYPSFSQTSLDSYRGTDGLCFDSGQNYSATAVIIDEPAAYDLKIMPSQAAPGVMGLGFLSPLTPEIHHHEIIFCNGMENCPVD